MGQNLRDIWNPSGNAKHPTGRGRPEPEDGQADQRDNLLERGLGQDHRGRTDQARAGRLFPAQVTSFWAFKMQQGLHSTRIWGPRD